MGVAIYAPYTPRNLEVDGSYVTRILKLTTLAPNIVEAIINGEDPDGLSLASLIKSFPTEWSEQGSLFGFEDSAEARSARCAENA